DLEIARRYALLWEEETARERIWGLIEAEFELTRRELLSVTDASRLLAREPHLQASIDRRKPYVDPLSFIQVELLRRARAGDRVEGVARVRFERALPLELLTRPAPRQPPLGVEPDGSPVAVELDQVPAGVAGGRGQRDDAEAAADEAEQDRVGVIGGDCLE